MGLGVGRGVAFGVGLATLVHAEEPKGKADKPGDDTPVKVTPQAEAVGQITLAESLIDYGRKEKVPEARLAAYTAKEHQSQKLPAGAGNSPQG